MTKHFSNDFLWGNSVSSMQTEGAWNLDGKGLSVYDVKEATSNTSDWKVATDVYHRYEEDIRLMKEMGMNCYRFSISWSRIFPNGDGEVNEDGIAFYEKLIDTLRAYDIEPMICLYHFDMPLHLASEYQGFASRYVMDAFVNYGSLVIDRFKDRVKYWLTFNEQNVFGWSVDHGGCTLPVSEKLIYQVNHHVLMAHAKVVNYLRKVAPECQIGGMIATQLFYPASSQPEDEMAAKLVDESMNQFFLEVFTHGQYPTFMLNYFQQKDCYPQMHNSDLEELEESTCDFLAFSYYASGTISAEDIHEETPLYQYLDLGKRKNPYLTETEWGWQIDPVGFKYILIDMHNRYKLPIFPIENGIGVQETQPENDIIYDDYRIEYHRNHIKEMQKAIDFGVHCIGYLGWGLIDILSSKGEMKKRYGMVYVNRGEHELRDLRRIPKKSFYWMQQVTESNGSSIDNIDI